MVMNLPLVNSKHAISSPKLSAVRISRYCTYREGTSINKTSIEDGISKGKIIYGIFND